MDSTNALSDSLAEILNDIPLPASDVMSVGASHIDNVDIFAEKKRNPWDKTAKARCDFTPKLRIARHASVVAISIWQKSIYGKTLTEIKSDENMIDFFAENMAETIIDTLGKSLHLSDWAIVTTPSRRHIDRNFATLVADNIANLIGIKFYPDVAKCKNKTRLNLNYTLNYLPKERNIIIFDDIVTTGNTIHAMKNILSDKSKT